MRYIIIWLWQLFSWAHDRFRDMHISGDKHIEIIRGECDSLVNLYKITEQTDEKKYIDMKDRILNDLESLVLMYPNEYFEEKQVLKVKLLCFKGEQCLRKGGINNIEAAGQLLSEAYQIVTEGKYRHSIEYNMLRMRICMSLGDVIFKNRDRYSIKNSEKFYNEALQISLQIRNRNKSIETIEMAMNAYIRKADFLFEAADHTFSLFAYIKQEDAIDCIDYCGRLADTINRKKHSLKKEYLYNRILHKKVVVGRRHNSTNRTGRLGLEIGLELLEKEMEELRESGAMFPYYDRDYAECAYEIAYHKFCLEEYGFRESYDLCKIAYDISVKYIEKDNSIDNRMYKAKYASLLSELLANTVNVDYWKAALNYIIQAIDIYRDNMSIRQDFISKVYYGNALRQYLLICEDIGGSQFRNDREIYSIPKIPYTDHLQGVKSVLLSSLSQIGECDDEQLIEDMCNAALGHDLLEDTEVTEKEILDTTNERVLNMIKELTNPVDDSHTEQYMEQLKNASEEARLIKYADLIENTSSVAYNYYMLGEEWVSSFYYPILQATQSMLSETVFDSYPKTADFMRGVLSIYADLLKTKRSINKG